MESSVTPTAVESDPSLDYRRKKTLDKGKISKSLSFAHIIHPQASFCVKEGSRDEGELDSL